MEDQGLVGTMCVKMEAHACPIAIRTTISGASVHRDPGVPTARKVSILAPHSYHLLPLSPSPT